jgi:hypothetical protein
MSAASGVTQLAQGFGLDLPDAFAGNIKILPDFLQGVIFAIEQPEAQF